MTARSATDVLVAAAAALVDQRDVAEALDQLLAGSAEVLGVTAIGVLVRPAAGHPLELLATTSHHVEQLELFELEQDDGPCVESVRTGGLVVAGSSGDLLTRWPTVGAAITAAGYDTVYAFPLRWHGTTVGALNAFRSAARGAEPDHPVTDLALGQAVADLATVMIFSPSTTDAATVDRRLQRVLAGRIVLEQAKGVLAEQHQITPGEAYAQLRADAEASGQTLTAAARTVLDAARRRTP